VGSKVAFEQASIGIVKTEEYQRLKAAIERVLAPAQVEKFLKLLEKNKLRARQWEQVLERGLLEKVDEELRRSGATARALYEGLPLSDQGQVREFFLLAVDEQVEPALRAKYNRLYRYY
jgi:galactokinase